MFREFFLFCEECNKVTNFACSDDGDDVIGECEECEYPEVFDDWDEVVRRSYSD